MKSTRYLLLTDNNKGVQKSRRFKSKIPALAATLKYMRSNNKMGEFYGPEVQLYAITTGLTDEYNFAGTKYSHEGGEHHRKLVDVYLLRDQIWMGNYSLIVRYAKEKGITL